MARAVSAGYWKMSKTVDQKLVKRRDVLLAKIREAAPVLAATGSIVETWRTYQGRRLGPYYRLAYRESGRQKTIYVGKDAELVAAARSLLEELQVNERIRRTMERQQLAVRVGLRAAKAAWAQELQRSGLTLKGYEVRGWRRLRSKKQDL
jgi:hypothetical protein